MHIALALVTLIVLAVFISKMIYNSKLHERFYTLFIPYKSNSEMIGKYVNLTTSTKYNYEALIFAVADRKDYHHIKEFITKLLKMMIAYSPILTFDLIKLNNSQDVCIEVAKGHANMGITSLPILTNVINQNRVNLGVNMKNSLRFIANIGNQYVYLIVRKDSKFTNVDDLKDRKINIGEENTSVWQFGQDIMKYLQVSDMGMQTFTMHHIPALFALLNGNIDAMFYTDYYPSKFLERIFVDYDKKKELTLLPLGNNKLMQNFTQSYFYYEPAVLDLNKMPKTYLPVKIGNTYYTRFNPDMPTYMFSQTIISNRETSGEAIYNFTKFYYQNVNSFDQNKNIFNLSVDRLMLFIHRGAYKFYKEKGYVNENINDKNCMYLIGKTECNNRSLDVVKQSSKIV